MSASQPQSENFAFLAVHDPELVRLGAGAERFFAHDPDVSLMRLRQLGEQPRASQLFHTLRQVGNPAAAAKEKKPTKRR